MSGINTSDAKYGSLSINSKVIVDNNFNLKINDARINGLLDVRGAAASEFIRPYNIASNSLDTPVVMSQQVKISNRNNMRIKFKALNDRGTFDFGGLTGTGQTYQFWINYYDGMGNTLISTFPSTAFEAETQTDKTVPSGSVTMGSIFEYDVIINNIHFQKPQAAEYWSFTMRINDNNYGVTSFNEEVPIESFYVTMF